MIEGILVDGLIFALLALGVFISFRILDFPDLTVDGSFATGAAIAAICIINGLGIFAATVLAFIGGAVAGAATATIHNKLKLPNLLSGILVMTMLYSINIRILGGRANIALLRVDTMITKVIGFGGSLPREYTLLIFMLLFVGIIKILIDIFFRTDLGITMGALGNNEQMIKTNGVNPETMKVIGLSLSNGLVALSGAILGQYQGFADAKLGQGMIVEGLAAVMLGEFLLRSNKIFVITLRVVLGAILYKGLMFFGRYYGYYIHMTPSDLKLITSVLVIVSLVIARSQDAAGQRRKERR
ncbi:MAG: ABC transporter permease [Spirochaetia bacterium]|jgi:putative tryptophan/tyrosine transport system permease protein|nr:ABC transporter permease [Spirochaetia bacterium]